jgi:rare lipoprotein A
MKAGGLWLAGGILAVATILTGCASRQPQALVPPYPAPIAASGRPAILGTASWYGPGFNGHRTSSGAVYNQDDLTAASVMFPLGAIVRVTNLANGRAVDVAINDHGPYLHGRTIDLSRRAAIALGMIGPGTAHVRMEVLASPAGGPPIGMRYFVQVGSYANPANAQRMRLLVAQYYPDAAVVEANDGEAQLYRVRMGAFMDHDAAAARAAHLAELGYPAKLITE